MEHLSTDMEQQNQQQQQVQWRRDSNQAGKKQQIEHLHQVGQLQD